MKNPLEWWYAGNKANADDKKLTGSEAEATAALHSIEKVVQLGMTRIILETDATELQLHVNQVPELVFHQLDSGDLPRAPG
uniref:Uncharacterized protein n=1 Tax=Oryza sativa subsp. japonica TaxID=39947 RepID=Q8GRP3_ORYSJ|nr:hypothetical protein [Oryza sativa Japonica Group]BAD30409.1 hypothetical protein [Oryza sativa Japonica Group]